MSEFFTHTIPGGEEGRLLPVENDTGDTGLAIHAVKKSDIAKGVVHLVDDTPSLNFQKTISDSGLYWIGC